MRTCFSTVLFILLAALPARGDILVLSDGESLSGSVQRIRQSILVFRTALSGQMTVPLDNVAALTTESPVVITLQDGTTLTGRLVADGAANRLVPLGDGDPVALDLSSIEEAEVVPRNAAESPPESPIEPEMKGALGVGAIGRSGNATGVTPFTSFQLEREGPRTRLRARAFLAQGEEEFPEWLRAGLILDRTDPGWSPYASVDIERDQESALDLRTDLALGVRYRRAATDDAYWEAIGGVAVSQVDADTRATRWRATGTTSETDLNLQLGLRYSRALLGKSTLDGALLLYPAIDDPGRVRLTSETNVTYPITETLRLRLNLLLDYESDPIATDLKRWDAALGAGLSITF
jgi:hypothetical protein